MGCDKGLYPARLVHLRVFLALKESKSADILTTEAPKEAAMVLLREAVGHTLRGARTAQSRTLRDVAREARVSLGYLSEVERGQKEASSELLNAICEALGLTLSSVMTGVTHELASRESAKLTVVDAA